MKPRAGACLIAVVLAIALVSGTAAAEDRALLDATKRGDVGAVRSLLADGADPNAAQGDGLTALHLAAQAGNIEIAQLLIDAGARVAATTRIGGYMPIHLASGAAQASLVSALIEAGAEPGVATTGSGVTPLHLAAKAFNGESTVRVLLARGAPVDALEASAGQTPLMFAASYGRTAAVRELLGHGADPAIHTEVVDVLKRMVIDQAAQTRLQEAQKEILESSPEGTDRVLTPAEAQAAVAAQREFLRSDEAIEKLLVDFHPDDLANRRLYSATKVEYLARPWFETLVGKTGGVDGVAARGPRRPYRSGGGAPGRRSRHRPGQRRRRKQSPRQRRAEWSLRSGAGSDRAGRRIRTWRPTPTGSHRSLVCCRPSGRTLPVTPVPRAHEHQQSTYMDVLRALLAAGADPNVPIKRHLWYWEFVVRTGGARRQRCHPVLARRDRAGHRGDEVAGGLRRRPERSDQVGRGRHERCTARGRAKRG